MSIAVLDNLKGVCQREFTAGTPRVKAYSAVGSEINEAIRALSGNQSLADTYMSEAEENRREAALSGGELADLFMRSSDDFVRAAALTTYSGLVDGAVNAVTGLLPDNTPSTATPLMYEMTSVGATMHNRVLQQERFGGPLNTADVVQGWRDLDVVTLGHLHGQNLEDGVKGVILGSYHSAYVNVVRYVHSATVPAHRA